MTKLAAPKFAPPTKYQLETLSRGLDNFLALEHAAALAGIPSKVISEWLILGKQGNHEFAKFSAMLEEKLARQAEMLLSPIVTAAQEGDAKSAQYLYNLRIKPHEDRALKRRWLKEDQAEERAALIEAAEAIEGADLAAALLLQSGEEPTPENG